jgi:hypothetical protein
MRFSGNWHQGLKGVANRHTKWHQGLKGVTFYKRRGGSAKAFVLVLASISAEGVL